MKSILLTFYKWRLRNINDYYFTILIAILIGFIAGLVAFMIKKSVEIVQSLVLFQGFKQMHQYLYFIYPLIGISLAVIFIKFIVKQNVNHGVSGVLYSISKNNAKIKKHYMFSSLVASALTVGFGGSVGLEAPTVVTGAAFGANIAEAFRFDYKQRTILLACACAASMAAILKAPMAGIVFALEVIMLDYTMASIIPVLAATMTGVITSFYFFGLNVIYPFEVTGDGFIFERLPFYILLGITSGFVSVHFIRIYIYFEKLFNKINKWYFKLLIGGLSLGVLIYLFPSLYGEGFEAINSALHGDYSYLTENTIFSTFSENIFWIIALFIFVIGLKVVATSITFGSGGIGGVFIPTLFTGANTGLFFAVLVNFTGISAISKSNFAMLGMGGLITGVLHAPLTAIFLISDLTAGYKLLVPLSIVAGFSFITTKLFEKNSVYTHQLAKRGELLTHNKDKNILSLMKVNDLIETDFKTISPDAKLGDLIKIIPETNRNIFSVIDADNDFVGIVTLDDVRKIMFMPELYDSTLISDIMYVPSITIDIDDNVEIIAQKFQNSNKFNIVVLKAGKYLGFVSRANLFSSYRKMLKHFSDD